MELSEIKQFNHKKQQINITNKNTASIYEEIIFKISLNVADNEIVRFSLEPNDNFLPHQSIDNDYFIRIPNQLNKTFPIYAHYFAADLYEYEEDTTIFSIYDLSQLTKTNTDTFNGKPVLQINSQGYDMKLGADNKPYIRSLLSSQISDKYKNPNYKNYINSDIPPKDMTQQGMFPMSSRYRSLYGYVTAPNVLENPNAYWQAEPQALYTPCVNSNTTRPFWEAKIHRTLLSPLITEGVDDPTTLEDFNLESLNVFLNYQYLPTSTEYHQHYFGFEGDIYTKSSDFSIFEHTNLYKINSIFNSQNNYNIINAGNVIDNNHGIFVEHENKINIALSDFEQNVHNCTFDKNICDDYFIYTPMQANNYAIKNIKLKNDKEYVLKYYIYIPIETYAEPNSCHIQIERTYNTYSDIEDGVELTTNTDIYKLNDIFLTQDKILRNQWIYHEIPFIGSEDIKIKIIGPQHGNDEHIIFFCNLEIHENIEYTPTLKYTNTGLFLMENGVSTFKPIKEESYKECVPVTPTQALWTNTNKLPTPHGNIYIRMNDDIYLYYDNITTNLSYNGPNYYRDNNQQLHNNEYFWLSYENYEQDMGRLIWNNTENAQLSYNNDTGILSFTTKRDSKKIFTKGPGNWFILNIEDSYKKPVNIGEVECAIFAQKTYDLHAPPIKYIGKKKVNNLGEVYFNNINLSAIDIIDNKPTRYYLRIIYTNKCLKKRIIQFKSIFVEPQHTYGKIYVNDTQITNTYTVQSYNDIPLKIDLFLYNQLNNIIDNGYCELSIDDTVTQTTIIDNNGRGDFYLNFNDLPKNKHRIKIVYYNRFFTPILWFYFDIIINNIDRRDAIPIIIKDLQNATEVIFEDEDYIIDNDDAVLMCIDTHNHQNFRIEVTKNGTLMTDISQNIYTYDNDDIILVDTDVNHEDIQKINRYVITTKSINANGPYRTVHRNLNIIRKPKDIGAITIDLSVDTQEFHRLSDIATFTAKVTDNRMEPVNNLLIQLVEKYDNKTNVLWAETDKNGYAVFYATPHDMNTVTYYVQNIKTTTVPYGKSENITIPFNKIMIQQSISGTWSGRVLNITFTNKQPNQNLLLKINNNSFITLMYEDNNSSTLQIPFNDNIDITNITLVLQQYDDDEYIYSGATLHTKGPAPVVPWSGSVDPP